MIKDFVEAKATGIKDLEDMWACQGFLLKKKNLILVWLLTVDYGISLYLNNEYYDEEIDIKKVPEEKCIKYFSEILSPNLF